MFEDWAAIALDVPPAPADSDDLRDFMQHHADRCAFNGNVIRHVSFEARKPIVGGTPVLHGPSLDQVPEDSSVCFSWDPAFAERFRPLTRWFESLPFRQLSGLTFVTQTADIPDHMDIFGDHNATTYYEANRTVEPAYYRAVFTHPGDRLSKNGSFYVTETYDGPRQFVQFPPERSIAAISTSTVYHGAVHHPGRFKTTAAVYGALDEDVHRALLARSLERFPDHAIRLSRPGPVSGPGARRPYRAPYG